MLSSYLNITIIAEWCCFIAALYFLDKKTKQWQLFIALLFLVLSTETSGWYIYNKLHRPNAWPFNLLMIISNVFFIWFFSKSSYLQKIKRVLQGLNLLFILFALVNIIFFQGFWIYNSYSETFADIVLIIICCYFFLSTILTREYINLTGLDYFWLATGIFFSALGSALLYQFSDLLRQFYIQTKIDVGTYINYGLNIILYTSFIISFICRWKNSRTNVKG